MGRPRKRRRAEDELHQSASGGPLGGGGDGLQTMIQSSSLEDLLASKSSQRYDFEGLDQGALPWDPSQPLFDFSGWDLAAESGEFFDENGVVPLHPPMPTDRLQINVDSAPTPGDIATTPIQTTSSETSPQTGPGCACLVNLYLTLASFQSLPPPSFPLTSGNLKIATNVARDVLRCPRCPQAFNSAFQNISLLGTLLPLIIMEYSKLVHHIDVKSDSGESMTFRMGEQNPAHKHLHTGTVDCPLGFNIELSAAEWCMTARKVVRQQVHGVKPGDESLNSLIDELEQRQHAWHSTNYPQKVERHVAICAVDEDNGEPGCLRVIRNLKKSIMALNLSDELLNLL